MGWFHEVPKFMIVCLRQRGTRILLQLPNYFEKKVDILKEKQLNLYKDFTLHATGDKIKIYASDL